MPFDVNDDRNRLALDRALKEASSHRDSAAAGMAADMISEWGGGGRPEPPGTPSVDCLAEQARLLPFGKDRRRRRLAIWDAIAAYEDWGSTLG